MLGWRARRDSNSFVMSRWPASFGKNATKWLLWAFCREEQASALHSGCIRKVACGRTIASGPLFSKSRPGGSTGRGERAITKVVAATGSKSPRSTSVGFGQNLPVPMPHATPDAPAASIAVAHARRVRIDRGANRINRENSQRRVVVTAEVRGRDIGSLLAEAQVKVAEQIKLAPDAYLKWGRQFGNFSVARQRLLFVVPSCFALIWRGP